MRLQVGGADLTCVRSAVRPLVPPVYPADYLRRVDHVGGSAVRGCDDLTATSKSVVQCNVGKKSPILLCSLVPDKAETCHLELEFDEDNDVVFSVLGQRSVHLCGYYLGACRGHGDGGDETYPYQFRELVF
ncbi:hypothetical protein B296_00046986 [Ensete ventricosum]|uniref:peptidylprolyl isomerase n=1 Tax=Ensete ventricosum TaxID=4639 RepID=A0A426X577_ENSVE|nr:hypothetical protein B296_00046986 [Ensete ventricosum]